MKNPFIKASSKKKHLKISLYGGPGVGKTYFALGFPNPAVIDLEGGTDFYADRFQFHVLDTKSYSEVLNAVNFLEQGNHDFRTLVIDPITVIWSALQDGRLEYKVQEPDKAIAGEEKSGFSYVDWMQIKRFYSLLMTKLVNLPMHVVMTGRLKDEYKVRGGEIVKAGVKMEAEKSTPYAPDICFRLEVEDGKRVAVFEKDRTGHFDRGTTIDNPSYETFRPLLEENDDNCESQARHHEEDDAIRKDAEFFQEQEQAQDTFHSMTSDILESFDRLGFPSEFRWRYLLYCCRKYNIESLTQLSAKQLSEQRKILVRLTKNEDWRRQFKEYLATMSPDAG